METNSVRETTFIGSTGKEMAQPALTATPKNAVAVPKPAEATASRGGSRMLKRIFSAGVLLPVLAGLLFLALWEFQFFIRSLI